MTKKSKIPHDLNKLAQFITEQATSKHTLIETPTQEESPQKNQAAVELGRLGGLKDGKARAEKLTKEERKEIARKAAKARWNKKNNYSV